MSGGNPTDDGLPFLLRREFHRAQLAQRGDDRTVKAWLEIDQPRELTGKAGFEVPLVGVVEADYATKPGELQAARPGMLTRDSDQARAALFLGEKSVLGLNTVSQRMALVADQDSALGKFHDAINEKLPSKARVTLYSVPNSQQFGRLDYAIEIDLSRVAEAERPDVEQLKVILKAASVAVEYDTDHAMPATVAFKPKDDSGVGRMVGDAVDAAAETSTVSFVEQAAAARANRGGVVVVAVVLHLLR